MLECGHHTIKMLPICFSYDPSVDEVYFRLVMTGQIRCLEVLNLLFECTHFVYVAA